MSAPRCSGSAGRRRSPVRMLGAVTCGVCLLVSTAATASPGRPNRNATQDGAAPTSTAAAGSTERRGIVVIDLTASTKDPDATQVMAFRAEQVEGGSDPDCTVAGDGDGGAPAPRAKTSSSVVPAKPSVTGDVLNQLSALVACAVDSAAPIDQRAAAARRVLAVARAHRAARSLRIFSTAGDQVQVVVVDAVSLFALEGRTFLARGAEPDVVFTEKERSMQIVSDLRSLARLATVIVTEAVVREEDPLARYQPDKISVTSGVWVHPFERTLTLKRATLTITAAAGRRPVLQAADGLSEDLANRFLERWDASMAPGAAIACKEGKPALAGLEGAPFAVLLCAAVVDHPPAASPPGPSHPTVDGGPPSSAPGAEKATPEIALRVEAIQSLGRLGDVRAIPYLVSLSYAPHPQEVREAALTSLSQFKSASAKSSPPDPDENAAPKADLLTGPKEHWFLSAAVPLTKATALKLDAKTDQLVLDDEPSAFYVGVNFLAGDLSDDRRTVLENLVFSILVKASRRPLDSLGVSVGLRGQYLNRLGLNLDVLTPFVGWTFTKEAVQEGEIVRERGPRNAELRFGVALNLDQALKWVGR